MRGHRQLEVQHFERLAKREHLQVVQLPVPHRLDCRNRVVDPDSVRHVRKGGFEFQVALFANLKQIH